MSKTPREKLRESLERAAKKFLELPDWLRSSVSADRIFDVPKPQVVAQEIAQRHKELLDKIDDFLKYSGYWQGERCATIRYLVDTLNTFEKNKPQELLNDLEVWHNQQHNPKSDIGECYIPGLGIVRKCLVCGCLIAGDSTRCNKCAKFSLI